MTQTQRLRLAKTNPGALAELEQQETERLHRRISSRSVLYSDRVYEGPHPDIPPLHLGPQEHGTVEVDQTERAYRTDNDTGRSDVQRRRPIPTPRISKVQSTDIREVLRRQQTYLDDVEAIPSPTSYEYKTRQSHITADGSEYSLSFEASEEYLSPKFGKTQIITSPKYPPPISPRKLTSRSQNSMSYDRHSADFDDSKMLSADIEGLEPDLQQYREVFSESEDFSGAEPELRKVVDYYSDDEVDSVRSYRPASSMSSYKNAAFVPKVTSSVLSPQAASNQHLSKEMMEESAAMTAVQASNAPLTESNESTAYIPRSAIPSQSFDSFGGEPRSPTHRPRPSPRRPLPRMESQNTESVSSYVPSDSVDSGDGYSDDFDLEDDSEYQGIRTMSKLKISAQAKLGYTT